ncbi:MAG: 3-deoxy-D-manno-octulosonic acid kinase [Psychromonas sp.]|jgi:3-deoxy-D-manno-octulosonic acid kinase|uniref:3-deoxy-D-manno-octulosonic acid kinase n=1 Tax=Psychromonas sp. TaxID=1884585 RepID=UPI0039E5DA05
MIKILQTNRVYIVYDDELINECVDGCFFAEYWQQQGKIIGSAQGRGTTWFIQLDKLQGALRHYCRGGLFGKIISDHYLFTGWQKTRSLQEFYLLDKLTYAGVNVPKPIAARVEKGMFSYQADLLSEKIPDAQDLVDILQTRALSKSEYQAIGRQIKKMHNAQVNHSDLNIHNILLDKAGEIWLIDFDKCYQQSGDNWKAANLARLLRSFNKELKKRAIKWQLADWQHLMSGYSA